MLVLKFLRRGEIVQWPLSNREGIQAVSLPFTSSHLEISGKNRMAPKGWATLFSQVILMKLDFFFPAFFASTFPRWSRGDVSSTGSSGWRRGKVESHIPWCWYRRWKSCFSSLQGGGVSGEATAWWQLVTCHKAINVWINLWAYIFVCGASSINRCLSLNFSGGSWRWFCPLPQGMGNMWLRNSSSWIPSMQRKWSERLTVHKCWAMISCCVGGKQQKDS